MGGLNIGDRIYFYRSVAGAAVGVFTALLDYFVGGLSGYGSGLTAVGLATVFYVFTIPLLYGLKTGGRLSTAYIVFKGIIGYYVSWFLAWTILYNYGLHH